MLLNYVENAKMMYVDKSDVNCMIFRICSSENVFIDEVTTFFYFLG